MKGYQFFVDILISIALFDSIIGGFAEKSTKLDIKHKNINSIFHVRYSNVLTPVFDLEIFFQFSLSFLSSQHFNLRK